MSNTVLSPLTVQRFNDSNGNPLAGGLLYTYIAGTSTPQTTYTDFTGVTPNTNPVVMNSRGEANVWMAAGQTYKFSLFDAASNLIWTVDQVNSVSSSGYLNVKSYGATGDGITNDSLAIAAGITAAAGGVLLFPTGSYIGSLPAVYTASLEYLGPNTPINVYAESGETTRFSKGVKRAQSAASHTGIEKSLYTFENRPVGSGTNGPTSADYGVTISNIKQNWVSTNVLGELDGLNIITRNGGAGGGGSDSAGILINSAVAGVSGYCAAIESVTTLIATNTGAVVRDVRNQVGVVDPVNGNYIGFYALSSTGGGTTGLLISANAGSAWVDYLRFSNSTQEFFRVTGTGVTVLTEPGTPANIKSLRVNGNNLSVLNASNVEIMTLSDAGLLNVGGKLTAGDYPAAPTAYSPTISSASGTFSNATIVSANFITRGSITFVDIYYNIITPGTAAGALVFTLPSATSAIGFIGGTGYSAGKNMQCFTTGASSSTVSFNLYDGTTPCATTGQGHVSFHYM